MAQLIINLIQVSLIMSIAALGLHLITSIFSKIISPRWRYYLWGIILISFLLPFRPQFWQPVATINAPGNMQDNSGENAGTAQNVEVSTDASQGIRSIWSQIDLPTLLICVWIAGIVIFIGVVLYKHLKFMHTAKRWGEKVDDETTLALVSDTMAEMNIRADIEIIESKMVSVPMMAGVFKPVLFLPRYDLDDEELEYVIRHELIHYRKFDIFVKLMSVFANAVHWFNPMVYVMQRWIHTDCEVACDYEVTHSYEQDEKIRYLETIIGVAKHEAKYKTVFSTNFYSGKNTMKKRLESVLETHRMRAALVVIIVVALIMISIAAGSALAVNNNSVSQPSTANEDVITDEAISQNLSTSNGAVSPDKPDDDSSNNKEDSGNSNLIGTSKAKTIALNRVGGGTVTEFELDTDDGVQKYEAKVELDGYEYEIDIDAKTGKILKYEKEKIEHDDHDDD